MTKMWLKDRDYEFIEYNISENVQHAEDLERMGYRVTPVTVVNKETMIVGFNPQKLIEALE
jgi:glutaredoxin